MDITKYRVNKKIELKAIPTREDEHLERAEVEKKYMPANLDLMAELQDRLYADGRHGLLIVFQAMDTAGKDGIIKHVMTSFNPQGVYVASFKVPSSTEASHDYLWRIHQHAPSRGSVTIFNRSHYEEVIVTQVHNLVEKQNVPDSMKTSAIWQERYAQIRNYEAYLTANGINILKFFLHLSKEEQKKRLLARIDKPSKNWKFSASDIKERTFWNEYQRVYEKAINETSTADAPWYIIPADKKWFARYLVSQIVVEKLQEINPQFPVLPEDEVKKLDLWKKELLSEND
ncbi:MAG: polyphosphate kinase 2 family protein [Spirochaetaceae bacterium]|nr:polyphosphate kinase 2 family protein [Spirochaetaceae bacterium]